MGSMADSHSVRLVERFEDDGGDDNKPKPRVDMNRTDSENDTDSREYDWYDSLRSQLSSKVQYKNE